MKRKLKKKKKRKMINQHPIKGAAAALCLGCGVTLFKFSSITILPEFLCGLALAIFISIIQDMR